MTPTPPSSARPAATHWHRPRPNIIHPDRCATCGDLLAYRNHPSFLSRVHHWWVFR